MNKTLCRVIMFVVFILLYAPILMLIVFSFNAGNSQTVWQGFSFRWYEELFRDRDIMQALWNTVSVGLISAVASTVVGTLAAIGIFGMKKSTRGLIMNATYLPVLNPDILTGISLMLVYGLLQLPFGLMTLCISHITFNIPYVILSVMPKLRQFNMSTYEAALDLGARPLTAVRKVVLPEIMPGVFTGLIMAFTMSIDDFIISYFTAGTGTRTLPLIVYAMTKRKITPKINALSTLMFITVLLLLIIVNVRRTPKKKMEERR